MIRSPLSVRLGPLELKNPILTASGTFGYGLEFTEFVDLARIGGLCTKGLSLHAHAGNVPPRICETPAGMLNAIGLQNVGVDAFVNEKLPRLRELGATTIANVWGDTEEDYVTVVVDEKQLLIGTSRLMMMFGAKDFQLKQWVVTDPQGYDTTVALSNLDTTRRPDPNLFRIEYAR